MYGLLSATTFPSPSPLPLPCPRLTPGPGSTTTGPHAILCTLEIVALSSAAAIYKGLTEPGLGVVEVSDNFGLAGTCIWRLQAEVRLLGCRDGRISVKEREGHHSSVYKMNN